MVQHKAQLKKQQKRGVDFKKIKRKIGRKLPLKQNDTNTEVKSKAIILPEQSVASDKAGFALSKKGLTLKELLQQTSHHNSKVRRDALTGIRDIFLKHPAELKLHKLSVIEKLRERISDDDNMVRDTLYQLLKTVIFPGCKEDNKGPFISLMMAYIFNAMTHLANDVRLMAFKFFDLVVQYYPASFSLHAEKILQHYKEILRKNQFNLQDKGRLKSVLAGLAYCLSLLPSSNRQPDSFQNVVADRRILHAFESDMSKDPSEISGFPVIRKELKELLPILICCFQNFMPSVHTMPNLDAQSFDCMLSILKSIDLVVKFFIYGNDGSAQELQVGPPTYINGQIFLPIVLKKLFDVFPLSLTHKMSEKDDDRYLVFNVIVSEMFLCVSDWISPPSASLEKFLEFIESALSEKICSRENSSKAVCQKHLLTLIPFIPKLVMQLTGGWKLRILQAFTDAFKRSDPESLMKLACLSAIGEMLLPNQGQEYLITGESEILDFQTAWVRELPSLLILLDDKYPASSRAVLRLQLCLGQCASMNPSLSEEFDYMQYSMRDFYSTCFEGNVSYGPFMRLTRDIQELSVCCFYYFSFMDPLLLQSLVSCCLCHDLDPYMLFRLLEVVHAAYMAGHVQTADYISFLITLASRYKVSPESSSLTLEKCGKSNRAMLKRVVNAVCSCLSQIGDDQLLFKLMEEAVIDQISIQPPLDNICALLRMLVSLPSAPTRISERSITKLYHVLPGYLIDVVSIIPEEHMGSTMPSCKSESRYYLLPCFLLLYRSNKLLNLVLNDMASLVSKEHLLSSKLHSDSYVIDHLRTVSSVVSVLLLINEDARLQRTLSLYKGEIKDILENIWRLMSYEEINWTIEERHKIQRAYDRLRVVTGII